MNLQHRLYMQKLPAVAVLHMIYTFFFVAAFCVPNAGMGASASVWPHTLF